MDPQNVDNSSVDIIQFEQKFIKVYKQLTHLWNPSHPDYNNRFKRNISYDILLRVYRKVMPKATRSHVRQKINILRSCYRKERRKYLASRTVTPEGKVVNTFTPTSWKFYAMKFLDSEDSEKEADSNIVFESQSNPENSEEDIEYNIQEPELDTDDPDTKMHFSPIFIEDKPIDRWMDNSLDDNSILEREFEAIGANVICKLRRMNPQQRYHAELLINKVLISGLKEKLTDDTDLTDVWRLQDDLSEQSEKEDSLDNKSNIIELE